MTGIGGRALGRLTGRVLLVVAAVVAVVLGVLLALLFSISQVDRARAARAKSDSIVRAADQSQQAVVDMETGLRGYGLTHDRRFLQPWYQGRAQFGKAFGRLDSLTGSDSSGDEPIVEAIGTQGSLYVRDYGDPIVRRGMGGPRGAANLTDGKRRVDALRALFDRLRAINDRQATQRFADATAAIGRTRTIALAGLSVVLLLLALAARYLVRRVSWPIRRIAVAADALSGGELSVRAPEQGPGEVCELGRSFNSMAHSIEEGARSLRSQNDSLALARAEAERTALELSAQQDLAVDLVATIGFDGRFKRVNPAWERTLGYPAPELISSPFIDYVHPEDRERTEAEAARLAVEDMDTISFENRYRTESGEYRWLEWNVRPVASQDLLYAVARDVTDRKSADDEIRAARDEAQRANRAKSEFLSRMSHELRTPLNAILGFGQLLEMDGLQGRNAESVEQILRAGSHLLTLIDEVLDISRIESGTMGISVEPIDIVSALRDVTALIGPVAAERGIEISTDLNARAECYALADRQRLRQVVLNLLSNAVKYNRPGGSVTVSFSCDEQRVRLSVADTGHGIPADRLDRLFVAFDRLGAEHGEVEGTGLGLALSQNLVEQMGGSLHAESAAGTGSVFTVELQVAANPVSNAVLASARVAGEQYEQVGSQTILYIEDNPSNAKLVTQAFAGRPDVRLLLAMQGETGLELARAHRPDLILLDLHLPDMDGSTVLGALQEDINTASIPVIVLSADATLPQRRALIAGGARAYLTKPLDVRAFLDVVNEQLTRKETLP